MLSKKTYINLNWVDKQNILKKYIMQKKTIIELYKCHKTNISNYKTIYLREANAIQVLPIPAAAKPSDHLI